MGETIKNGIRVSTRQKDTCAGRSNTPILLVASYLCLQQESDGVVFGTYRLGGGCDSHSRSSSRSSSFHCTACRWATPSFPAERWLSPRHCVHRQKQKNKTTHNKNENVSKENESDGHKTHNLLKTVERGNTCKHHEATPSKRSNSRSKPIVTIYQIVFSRLFIS